MTTADFKAGDRVVSRRTLTGEFLFGTIVCFVAGPAGSRWLCVQWDGQPNPDPYVRSDMIALMPTSPSPKASAMYVVGSVCSSACGWRLNAEMYKTEAAAVEVAKRATARDRDTTRVFMVTPVVEIVMPPVEVRKV